VQVTRFGRTPSGYRRLRPHQWLFRQGLIATVAFLAPVFAALYLLTVPDGPWVVVLLTQLIASLLVVLACASYLAVGVWVDKAAVVERGLLGGLITMPAADIGSIVLVHTDDASGGAETVPQLFICDHEGTQVIRLRGQFWSLDDMRAVGEILDVPITELSEAVTPRELLEQYPGLLYWFERRPVLAAGLFSACVLLGGSLLYLGLAAVGVT
jgi:hypothetical protein